MVTTTNTGGSGMSLLYMRTFAIAHLVQSEIPIQIVGFVPCSEASTECRDFNECCFKLPVFAHATSDDILYNDWNSFLFQYPNVTDTSTFTLQQYVASGWATVATLNDNTYGTYWPLNTGFADFPNYSGFLLSWHEVYDAFGEGMFRFVVTSTIFGSTSTLYSEIFCLKEYACNRTNKTVKFESWMNRKIGSITDDNIIFNLGTLDWYDSIRMPNSIYGYERSEYERTFIRYNNGQIDAVNDDQNPKSTFVSGQLPDWMHDRFKTYGLQADTLKVTDYNYHNPDYTITQRGIRCISSYEPRWNRTSRRASVTLEFEQKKNNLRKLYC